MTMLHYRSVCIVITFVFVILSSCHSRKATVYNSSMSKKELGNEKKELKDTHVKKSLRQEIDAWLGVPYRYGGNDKGGVDCSGFVNAIYLSVYHVKLPRTSKDIYKACRKIEDKELKEGDFVFFDYEGKGVSHVGIYLSDGKYAHASTSKGVLISDLNNLYARKKYVGAGRWKN